MSTNTTNTTHYTTSLFAGAVAGLTVDMALYPLDTLKTRLQSSQGFLRAGGFRGVYQGMQSVALGSAPASALFFLTYEQSSPHIRSYLQRYTNMSESQALTLSFLLASSLGEFMACTVRVPTDNVKIRMQSTRNMSMKAAARDALSLSTQGLYKGFSATLMRDIPFSMIQFPLYEALKRKWASTRYEHLIQSGVSHDDATQRAQLSPWLASLCGAVAGCVGACFTTPLDVARTRMMLVRDEYGGTYDRLIPSLRRIFTLACRLDKLADLQQKGILDTNLSPEARRVLLPTLEPGDLRRYGMAGTRALFSGVSPRMTWIGLGGCVYFGTFELAKKAYTTVVPVPESSLAL